MDETDTSCMALLQVSALSGDVLAEVNVGIYLSAHEIKAEILPIISPDASEYTVLKLFYDGQDIDEVASLSSFGLVEHDEACVTALIYDPLALAKMEIDLMHREAIERSHREALELRQQLLERRRELIAQRQQEVEQEFEARQAEPEGPLLMLAYEPANLAEPSSKAAYDGNLHRWDQSHLQSESPTQYSVPQAETSSELQARAKDVIESYESFFDHIAFRKGWKQPPFAREEVRPAFQRAACIVARVRAEVLDSRNTGIKIRQVEGSARDWMHDAESVQLLRSSSDAFVRGLVHATFKDANGYVEDLEEPQVDDFILLYSRL